MLAPLLHAMDQARVETRVDDAAAKFGVTGQGVIVAILDRGIDWRNNDFRNTNGSTRPNP
jgi:subtilisin family serine protease